jgi:hypothetical protein
MKMHLMLAVNDHHTGNFTGQVDQIEIDDLIYLEGQSASCQVQFHRPRWLEIGGLRFNLKGYRRWVGNICWDCATLEHIHVPRIIEHLRTIGWDCTEAETSLWEAYRDGQPITAKMLEDLMKEVE